MCSAVGLFPLSVAGIDLTEFLRGAQQAVKDGVSQDLSVNHSLISACLTHLHVQQGRSIHNSFFFSPKFEALGKWYRQLMGESLGKEHDKNGTAIHAGIVPIVSIGSTDLHSMAQLYWGGPDHLYTNLIHSFTGDIHATPTQLALPGLIAHIQNTSIESVMKALYGGVKAAYQKKERPYAEIDLEQADAYELGYYLQFRMIEIMYLAHLMNLNAFDQPAVELYKEVTRNLLAQS